MSIWARGIALLIEGLFYLILTIILARQFSRQPGRLRFDTLLVFTSATGALLLTGARIGLLGLGTPDSVTSALFRLSIVGGLLSVYGLFLLTADLAKGRHWLRWPGLSILLLGSGFTLTAPDSPTSSSPFLPGIQAPFQLFVMLTLFLGSCLCITICLWHSSAQILGAARQRLQWLGAGAGLACVGMTFALTRLFAPDTPPALLWLEYLALLLAGIVLYLGCMPADWLRRLWMLPELERAHHFCHTLMFRQPEINLGEDTHSQRAAISQMLQYTMNGLGAFAGTVELWNDQTGKLELAASILPADEDTPIIEAKTINDAVLLEVFRERQPRLLRFSRHRCPFLRRSLDAGAVLIAPLVSGEHALGVIGLCCEYAPHLHQRDLAWLQLFADQITCLLTHSAHQQQTAILKSIRSEQILKDEFIALIAHDLRTPLTVLKGRLQLLRRQLQKEGQTEAAELIARLDTPYNKLAQLITTLLDVSYIDTGRLELRRHAVDLIGLVRKVVEAISEREIALELAQDSHPQQGTQADNARPMIVLGDAARLEQVLTSLLDNARKYSPAGSSVTVRVECLQSGTEALLSVRDQGIGIPPEHQPRLFQRWFRATPSGSNYAGPGLGLYISHEIITRHGGRLWVESSGIPGEGSTFFFTLPLIPPGQVTETGETEVMTPGG